MRKIGGRDEEQGRSGKEQGRKIKEYGKTIEVTWRNAGGTWGAVAWEESETTGYARGKIKRKRG